MARDAKHVPLLSAFAWHGEAIERILRVPAGFMRNRTQDRIEALAGERGRDTINLALVEEGIEIGRQMMEEMLREATSAKEAVKAAVRGSAQPAAKANGNDAHEVPVSATEIQSALSEPQPALNEVGSPQPCRTASGRPAALRRRRGRWRRA